MLRRTNSVSEFYVPRSAFNGFMGEVNSSGTEVVLVETKRKNLEDFFLALVLLFFAARARFGPLGSILPHFPIGGMSSPDFDFLSFWNVYNRTSNRRLRISNSSLP